MLLGAVGVGLCVAQGWLHGPLSFLLTFVACSVMLSSGVAASGWRTGLEGVEEPTGNDRALWDELMKARDESFRWRGRALRLGWRRTRGRWMW